MLMSSTAEISQTKIRLRAQAPHGFSPEERVAVKLPAHVALHALHAGHGIAAHYKVLAVRLNWLAAAAKEFKEARALSHAASLATARIRSTLQCDGTQYKIIGAALCLADDATDLVTKREFTKFSDSAYRQARQVKLSGVTFKPLYAKAI